nr:tetratricopeptide repeat protein [Vulcaniibacterium tengchongense]
MLAAAIGAVLAFGAISQVSAQSAQERAEQRRARQAERAGKQEKPADEYPQATRKSPDIKASSKAGSKLQKLVKLYEDEKPAEARALADEIIGNASFNAYDRSFAAQIGAQAAYDADDTAAAMDYLKKAIEFNGLDNNAHFGAMFMLAQLQLQEDQYEQSLQTLDRFFAESKSTKPEHLVIKGNALYRLERYPEAAAVLKQAIDASPEPRNDWQQLLMAAYNEGGQSAEAVKIAENLAAKNPNDKRAQLNLAVVYQQADMLDKAAGVLEKLRASGQLTDDKEYRQLYATYLNMDGKEKEAVAAINDGLQKGVLKPDYQVYVALAQAYYFSDQFGPAIDAYRKAAPLAPDGETYLNLARLLWQEDRIPEAKEAAQQAIAKGVKKPEDAKKILALPAK